VIRFKTIGLTGGIASGKSSVAQILKRKDITVINADDISHQAIEPGNQAYFEVVKEFGAAILEVGGKIDRKKLGKIVFSNNQARQKLESIIHPVVIQTIREWITRSQKNGLKLLVVEVPLLFEVGIEDLFDLIWVVSISSLEQFRRLQERDGLSGEEANRRMAVQLPMAFKESKADVVIYNNQGLTELENQVIQLLKIVE
jgi:dephospho-CoA kinase